MKICANEVALVGTWFQSIDAILRGISRTARDLSKAIDTECYCELGSIPHRHLSTLFRKDHDVRPIRSARAALEVATTHRFAREGDLSASPLRL